MMHSWKDYELVNRYLVESNPRIDSSHFFYAELDPKTVVFRFSMQVTSRR